MSGPSTIKIQKTGVGGDCQGYTALSTAVFERYHYSIQIILRHKFIYRMAAIR